MFEEKRQRENLRKQEREKEKFERDLEIQTLKEQHSRELKQLRAKYESTQELSRFENVIHARMYTRNVKFEFRLYACNSVTLYSDLQNIIVRNLKLGLNHMFWACDNVHLYYLSIGRTLSKSKFFFFINYTFSHMKFFTKI